MVIEERVRAKIKKGKDEVDVPKSYRGMVYISRNKTEGLRDKVKEYVTIELFMQHLFDYESLLERTYFKDNKEAIYQKFYVTVNYMKDGDREYSWEIVTYRKKDDSFLHGETLDWTVQWLNAEQMERLNKFADSDGKMKKKLFG